MTDPFTQHRPKPAKGAPKRPAKPKPRAQAGDKADEPKEIDGPSGPEPTRYGDWEIKGRCIDF